MNLTNINEYEVMSLKEQGEYMRGPGRSKRKGGKMQLYYHLKNRNFKRWVKDRKCLRTEGFYCLWSHQGQVEAVVPMLTRDYEAMALNIFLLLAFKCNPRKPQQCAPSADIGSSWSSEIILDCPCAILLEPPNSVLLQPDVCSSWSSEIILDCPCIILLEPTPLCS